MNYFRVHGDNIVECERIINLIIAEVHPKEIKKDLLSPSTIVIDLSFSYLGKEYSWHFDLLPGFNKSGRKRWNSNIFNVLHQNGSFLDETPDAILTSIENNQETVLCAIEFCSALQAGNQAWQRSGRAFSTGCSGCPYLYIVDFVKYELDPVTRERKALRFPNPAVPYSYISFSQESNNFVAQVYVRSEDFDINADSSLRGFNEDDFGEAELSRYIVKLLCGIDTHVEEQILLHKNLNIVMFLADKQKSNNSFTRAQWQCLSTYSNSIVDFSIRNADFNFKKKISAKSDHGNVSSFLELVASISTGLASKDLPVGIIPADKRGILANGIHRLYPSYDATIISKIGKTDKPLLICIVKGFKPGGDDNRPDRGVLPLTSMLSGTSTEILTYIYGPIIRNNYDNLLNHPKRLAASNGIWKSFIALSDYIALDVPLLRSSSAKEAQALLDTSDLKTEYTNNVASTNLVSPAFSSKVNEYHEDDVDTGIHYTFAHILSDICFEGLCNPPGGDWSGISIIDNNKEKRWLSLPRVSGDIAGKRPDHVYEIFGLQDKPILLSIESKENSADLESNVGSSLINYLKYLMRFVPNVERPQNGPVESWNRAHNLVTSEAYEIISAAAYLKSTAQSNNLVYANSNCDMLFIMEPLNKGWNIEISAKTIRSNALKQYIAKMINKSSDNNVHII